MLTFFLSSFFIYFLLPFSFLHTEGTQNWWTWAMRNECHQRKCKFKRKRKHKVK